VTMTERRRRVARVLNVILTAHHDLVRGGTGHDDAVMHAEVVALIAAGRRRHAVGVVARRHAPAIGIPWQSLAHRLRRQIRAAR
jgi:hypothetical protein